MKKYDYKVHYSTDDDHKTLENAINDFASAGYRLIHFIKVDKYRFVCIFELILKGE